MTLTEGLDDIQMQPFLVDRLTGAVSLNFDPQREMKGYFDFTVCNPVWDFCKDCENPFLTKSVALEFHKSCWYVVRYIVLASVFFFQFKN